MFGRCKLYDEGNERIVNSITLFEWYYFQWLAKSSLAITRRSFSLLLFLLQFRLNIFNQSSNFRI